MSGNHQLNLSIHALKMADYDLFVSNYDKVFEKYVLFDEGTLTQLNNLYIGECIHARDLLKKLFHFLKTIYDLKSLEDKISESSALGTYRLTLERQIFVGSELTSEFGMMDFGFTGIDDPFFTDPKPPYKGNNMQAVYDHIEILYGAFAEYIKLLRSGNNTMKVLAVYAPGTTKQFVSIDYIYSEFLQKRNTKVVRSNEVFNIITKGLDVIETQLDSLEYNQHLIAVFLNDLKRLRLPKELMNRSTGIRKTIRKR